MLNKIQMYAVMKKAVLLNTPNLKQVASIGVPLRKYVVALLDYLANIFHIYQRNIYLVKLPKNVVCNSPTLPIVKIV